LRIILLPQAQKHLTTRSRQSSQIQQTKNGALVAIIYVSIPWLTTIVSHVGFANFFLDKLILMWHSWARRAAVQESRWAICSTLSMKNVGFGQKNLALAADFRKRARRSLRQAEENVNDSNLKYEQSIHINDVQVHEIVYAIIRPLGQFT
jgi:hypothetical protein